ncbi:unnamed protein product [Moneuplotes crassus]|uniref:non-specific serine/threonine protein kinase n=1 Tax=Euplotes crassus TaxID=5936 RepID=A0AAD1UFX0_EUPCR|nr:unnamed protein product [Moneuplotes crassus]
MPRHKKRKKSNQEEDKDGEWIVTEAAGGGSPKKKKQVRNSLKKDLINQKEKDRNKNSRTDNTRAESRPKEPEEEPTKSKRKRRRRRRKKKNDLNDGSDGSCDEHEGSFEIRRDELEAIQGIYPDGVIIYEPVLEKSLGEFSVVVKPSVEEGQKILCSLELKVKYRARYPTRSPIFKLSELHGLSPKEVAKVKEIIKMIKTKNQEDAHGWVYLVCLELSSFLSDLNKIKGDKRRKYELDKLNGVNSNDSDLEGEESEEDEEMKVGKNIVAEINRAKAKENRLQLMKMNKSESQSGINQPIGLKSSIPNLNFDFKTKYPNSRYLSDFEEISKIGRGGGGQVYMAKNRLDNLIYAVKKVKLDNTVQAQKENDRLLREVAVLSQLHNQYIVRYYQAWIEEIEDEEESDGEGDSITEEESSEEEESEDKASRLKRRHSASSYDFTISKRIPSGQPKYFDKDYIDDDSDSSGDLIFEENNDDSNSSDIFEDPDSISEKSATIQNPKKLLEEVKEEKSEKKEEKIKDQKRRRLYIQMEYCEKDTLRTWIESGVKDENEIWKYTEQILKALNYIHSMGLLHRDLKPANIFLDKELNIKLGDFGLAQELQSNQQDQYSKTGDLSFSRKSSKMDPKERLKQLRKSMNPNASKLNENKFSDPMMSMGIGTYYYMSPEQETKRNYDQKTDMFSLGIILFEMCADLRSLMEKDRALKYLRNEFKVPPEYLPKIPKNYVEMIEKLISENPEDRPNAEVLLKEEFLDPENNANNLSLAQYTYFLDYPDFKFSFDNYSKENDILNKVMKGCKKVFERHGAKFMESSTFKPMTNTFTIFMEKFDTNLDDIPRVLKKKSKNLKSSKKKDSNLNSDYIKIDYNHCEIVEKGKEQFSFEKQCLLKEKRRIEFINADQVFSRSAKYLSTNLVENWARYLNIKNPGFIKRYCVDKVFETHENKSFTSSHPLKNWEANFDICMSRDKGYLYNEDEDEGINEDEEIMHEVEVLSTNYEILSKYTKVLGNPKIIINSSLILDIIMEECNIDIKVRHKVLSVLSVCDKRTWNEIKKKLNETYSIPRKNVDKLGRLIKIEGTLEQVQKEIEAIKGIIMRKELLDVINDFFSFQSYCGWVGINKNFLYFDLGFVISQFHIFYCGFFYKIICTGNNEEISLFNENEVAYGGRYDNQVSHFDVPTRTSNMFAVGSCLNIQRIAFHIVKREQSDKEEMKAPSKYKNKIDVCIFTNEKNKEQGIRLLSEFWNQGIKALADFRNKKLRDIFDFCTIHTIRFLIILKDDKEGNNDSESSQDFERKVVKIKDFKTKTEDEIDINTVADYLYKRVFGRKHDK